MITIQGFAKLCGCNTQTLRYYDRIGLLAPAKVDQWTGYRYYEEGQAMLFVKIKNLQMADFSIGEIKTLLNEDEDHLMAAFDRKIEEQKQKLEQMENIRKSYLDEAMNMQRMVNTIIDFVEGRMSSPELWQEFGLDQEKDTEISARVHELLAEWMEQCKNAGADMAQYMDTMQEMVEKLKNGTLDEEQRKMLLSDEDDLEKDIPEGAEKIFARDGWAHVSDWIGEIPAPEKGKESFFLFSVPRDSLIVDPGFPTLMLAVMGARYNTQQGGMTCKVGLSKDGLNHFSLLQK